MPGPGQPGTAQLLDQLAALVPVVASLAAQVGQLTQVVQAPGAVAQEASAEDSLEVSVEDWGQGDSGEAVLGGESWTSATAEGCSAAEHCAGPGTDA